MLQKTEDTNFMRDVTTNALINTNVTAYKLFKQQRAQFQDNQSLQQEVDGLRNEIDELKQLLGKLTQNVGINR